MLEFKTAFYQWIQFLICPIKANNVSQFVCLYASTITDYMLNDAITCKSGKVPKLI